MTSDVQNGLIKWPSIPRDYQWKGTISLNTNTWSVLAYCKPLKSDVFIKIKQLTNDSTTDLDAFAANINNLINLHHSNLLTPVHSFHAKNDIWIIYPLSSGGPLSELLKNHYPNGIPDESIVACLLRDAAEALQYLHNHQIVHRNIRASSLHVNCIQGITLLTEFDVLKPIKFKHAKTRNNTMVTVNRYPWTDPLILSDDPNISWFQGDIYSFGVTALELVYGEIPPSKVIPNKMDLKQFMNNINYDAVGVESYHKPCPFGKIYQSFIKDCCNNRVSVGQLLKHPFFKKSCQRFKIKNEIGHLIRKTECRINSSLLAPSCFSLEISVEQISTSETKFDYNASISTVNDKSLILENIVQEKVNDYEIQPLPSMQVNIEQINGNISSRIRHISFSASDSNSDLNDETTSPNGKETVPDQRGRFNVEVLNNNHHSHSGSGAYENSLSSISEEHQHPHNIELLSDDDEQDQQTKSTMYGRFAVAKGNTPSTSTYSNAHEMNFSGDMEDDVNNRNTPALNNNITDSPPVFVDNALPVIPAVDDEQSVIKWSVDDCSYWLSTLGAAYVQYQEKFISNGIDGVLMKSLDDEMLKEIVPSKLHRTKIILSAKLLFPSVGNGSVYESSL